MVQARASAGREQRSLEQAALQGQDPHPVHARSVRVFSSAVLHLDQAAYRRHHSLLQAQRLTAHHQACPKCSSNLFLPRHMGTELCQKEIRPPQEHRCHPKRHPGTRRVPQVQRLPPGQAPLPLPGQAPPTPGLQGVRQRQACSVLVQPACKAGVPILDGGAQAPNPR